MTTITSRSLMPMLPLPINVSLRPNGVDSRMHQDNFRLGHHHHGLLLANAAPPHGLILTHGKEDSQRLSPPYLIRPSNEAGYENPLTDSPKNVLAYQSDLLERLNGVSTMHKTHDDFSDTRSSSVSSFQADSLHQLDANDDRLSCCSEDSELSVGKEEEGGVRVTPQSMFGSTSISRHSSGVRLPMASSHGEDMDTAEDSCSRTPLGQHSMGDKISNCSVDDMSNESISKSSNMISPNNAVPLRFPIVRPSPTRLQEEFLRNSQLYAEELMKHQMSFLAATKGLHLNGNKPVSIENPTEFRHQPNTPEPRAGFRPHVRQSEKELRWNLSEDINSSGSPEGSHFRGIHSHLNAISKITSALGREASSLKSPIGSMTSRESSQSPPSHYNHLINQNMLNDSNLKFSIDNILKPGFGRRITDPLLKRNKSNKKTISQKALQQQRNLQKLQLATEKHGTPIDLTSLNTSGSSTLVSVSTPSSASSSFTADATTPDPGSDASHLTANSSTATSNSPSDLLSPAGDQDKVSSTSNSTTASSSSSSPMVWPAWVYCTRYSDRPSSGPRTRRPKKPPSEKGSSSDEKRPRTAFSGPQLARLKHEFAENRYLTERRRQQLSGELGLNEAQIKIWFQNKRAKIKKSTGHKNPLALQLMAQGLYNHSTVPLTREEEEMQELQAQGTAGV